jgi:hypothetical protein
MAGSVSGLSFPPLDNHAYWKKENLGGVRHKNNNEAANAKEGRSVAGKARSDEKEIRAGNKS